MNCVKKNGITPGRKLKASKGMEGKTQRGEYIPKRRGEIE